MPSINSARYTQRIIQTVKSRLSEKSIFSEKVHRLDPPLHEHSSLRACAFARVHVRDWVTCIYVQVFVCNCVFMPM